MTTAEQRVKFAILCAQKVIGDTCPKWSEWAAKWLSGEDRTKKSADVAWSAEETLAARAREAGLAENWATYSAADAAYMATKSRG
jgi:hypothetical protein